MNRKITENYQSNKDNIMIIKNYFTLVMNALHRMKINDPIPNHNYIEISVILLVMISSFMTLVTSLSKSSL